MTAVPDIPPRAESEIWVDQRALTTCVRKVAAGESTPPRSRDHAELLVCMSGTATITVEGTCHLLIPGRAIWIPSESVNQMNFAKDTIVQRLLVTIGQDDDFPYPCRIFPTTPFLRAMIDEISALSPNPGDATRQSMLTNLVLGEIARAPCLAPSLPLPNDTRLRQVCETIVADPGDPRTLDDWAQILRLSRRSFTRLCSDELGVGFATWKRQLRLLHAASRIAAGEAVGVVATDVGFGNPSAFSALFRRTFGMTARDYCRR